ncbi:hypothetical protein A5717_26255 [Mycolicibacterium porcinum]|uniref:hypothetical protein n=1 Tax=Mycolicibacterium porcinum TaxID=39693 RepID=UPI00080B6141|nr:hypothetical protein [Mycolicibacterium porcinum]OCB09278.1 hypothetical protein A5717_26255 [Mycolicibacterium porcinum]
MSIDPDLRRIPELRIPGVYDCDEGEQRIDAALKRRRDQIYAAKQAERRRNREARKSRRQNKK